jgi:iron complex outermembrane receptor protein
VTGRTDPGAGVAGFGNVPLSKAPLQASVVGAEQLRDLGATRLSDVTRIDPAVGDAYNAQGYWDFLTVRGFVIDNRFNYRRDGLPINAETSIPLDNKDRIEILKGTTGLQAGTSAPGGLVNLVVKRPTSEPLRRAGLAWQQAGSVLASVDLGERFGVDRAFGLRVNAAAEHLDPRTRNAQGNRHLAALAGDWRLGADTLLEAEIETSHRSQPSVPGFSMLGDTVPDARSVDPRINLNNQPWSLPVVLDGNTASLRWQQRLSPAWRFTAHAMTQRLESDDRIAFPFGVFDPATFACAPCDRFAPDGSFTLWEFQSDNERRRSDALELTLAGSALRTGAVEHDVTAGVLFSRYRARLGPQLFDLAGTADITGTAVVPRSSGFLTTNTNRDERTTELFVRDAMKIGERFGAWWGLRHTRLHRESVLTDGNEATAYDQSFTTPWLAASWSPAADTSLYASWGEGIESEVVPNRARYTNRGQALPSLRSRQAEAGVKTARGDWRLGAALFQIVRPAFADFGADCFSDAVPGSCTRQVDGSVRHRGIELNAAWQAAPWIVQGGIQWLRARREGSATAGIDGNRPTNVPAAALKLLASHDVAALPGLQLQADLLAEGNRVVLPDNSARIPGYARVDAGVRYRHAVGTGTVLTWRAGVDNVFDRRAWKESPYQFSHVYLFPLAPRTWRLSVEAAL